LDAPGTLPHIIGWGIEGRKIFRNKGDKRDFLSCVAQLCQAGFWMVYVQACRLFCQLPVERIGYPAAEVACFLRVTTSAVVRAPHSENHPEIEKYL